MTTAERIVRLREMTQDEFDVFLVETHRDYLADLVRVGELDEAAATAKAAHDMLDVTADGPTGRRNRVFVVEDELGRSLGALWLGTRDDWQGAWIYDIRIDPSLQGNGLGRATLAAAEEHARGLGAEELGLHVFAHNDIARGLYETSSYETVETDRQGSVMRKRL